MFWILFIYQKNHLKLRNQCYVYVMDNYKYNWIFYDNYETKLNIKRSIIYKHLLLNHWNIFIGWTVQYFLIIKLNFVYLN